jgi:hypothetical protein
MKNNFRLIILLAAFAILFSGAASAGAAEPVKNPTLKDLQGHWQGNTSYDSPSFTTDCNLTVTGSKATYKSERGSGAFFNVTIAGEEINMVTPSGKTSNTCKLSKESDTLVLKCRIDVAAAPQAKVSKAMTGTMRLEKDK